MYAVVIHHSGDSSVGYAATFSAKRRQEDYIGSLQYHPSGSMLSR